MTKKTKPKIPDKPRRGKPAYIPSAQHIYTAYVGGKKRLTDKEIAKAIGIKYDLFRKHKSHFVAEIKRGREESDDLNCEKAEEALMKRALGFDTEEEKVTQRKAPDGSIMQEKVLIKKKVPPSDVAIMFYLVNRNSGRWRSINKEMAAPENSKGKIAAWFEKLEANQKKPGKD